MKPPYYCIIYVQHWRDRVSNEEVRTRGQILSTVGIDINELIFDCGNRGLVTFRTWDFGGQVREQTRIVSFIFVNYF